MYQKKSGGCLVHTIGMCKNDTFRKICSMLEWRPWKMSPPDRTSLLRSFYALSPAKTIHGRVSQPNLRKFSVLYKHFYGLELLMPTENNLVFSSSSGFPSNCRL